MKIEKIFADQSEDREEISRPIWRKRRYLQTNKKTEKILADQYEDREDISIPIRKQRYLPTNKKGEKIFANQSESREDLCRPDFADFKLHNLSLNWALPSLLEGCQV